MMGLYSNFSCFDISVHQTIHLTGKFEKYLKSIIEQKYIFSYTTNQIFSETLSTLNEIDVIFIQLFRYDLLPGHTITAS